MINFTFLAVIWIQLRILGVQQCQLVLYLSVMLTILIIAVILLLLK